ncbi:hypothetical protein V495_07529 [Pseudogymnoascus sp. VKM F-4514 (FW-929)]|nr:hypothetical protein V495_07529 [Pseudogymnoascus sp. VKM F-4514 (FW-929)]KFY53763.1 hypothetical protein V497_08273 [Pseudogymnoascus sp. VKM F-4516 (FW-969)]
MREGKVYSTKTQELARESGRRVRAAGILDQMQNPKAVDLKIKKSAGQEIKVKSGAEGRTYFWMSPKYYPSGLAHGVHITFVGSNITAWDAAYLSLGQPVTSHSNYRTVYWNHPSHDWALNRSTSPYLRHTAHTAATGNFDGQTEIKGQTGLRAPRSLVPLIGRAMSKDAPHVNLSSAVRTVALSPPLLSIPTTTEYQANVTGPGNSTCQLPTCIRSTRFQPQRMGLISRYSIVDLINGEAAKLSSRCAQYALLTAPAGNTAKRTVEYSQSAGLH